ncbi:MAG: hypothetical protein GYB68_07810 [Chloroflexi bacterium]|nr:hypothetical protein [Chloroflexota bacterium]
MSEQRPRAIIPRYKLILMYDISLENNESYYQFAMSRFIPVVQAMDVHLTEVWQTAYGEYPVRMISFVVEDLDTIRRMLQSEEWKRVEDQLQEYVENYTRKVVVYKPNFQFITE